MSTASRARNEKRPNSNSKPCHLCSGTGWTTHNGKKMLCSCRNGQVLNKKMSQAKKTSAAT